MGKINKHFPVKLIAGFIFKDENSLKLAERRLIARFGKLDFESKIIPFIHTSYYEKEFGKDLRRKFISFDKLIAPDKLSSIKIFTNKVEKKLSVGASRMINIDPGYLDLAKLVLATTKNFAHRIYLNKGIYAEVTLLYKDQKFCPLEWTYPDYKTNEYSQAFLAIRGLYAKQIRDVR